MGSAGRAERVLPQARSSTDLVSPPGGSELLATPPGWSVSQRASLQGTSGICKSFCVHRAVRPMPVVFLLCVFDPLCCARLQILVRWLPPCSFIKLGVGS